MPTPPALSPDRLDWFRDARFGMFIHWGLYSAMGRGEWAMSRERIPWPDYEPLLDQFTCEQYDPKAWAALARDAGMKYAVLTAKHHEGFCLWDSTLCDFNATRSAAKRDVLAEYVTAFREAGLKVGLYYSLGDWRHPGWAQGWTDPAAREDFMAYTHGLVEELLTGYGTIDMLWYDLPQTYTPEQWRSVDLNHRARQLQPNILINNRAMTTEDFATPEQKIAASEPGRMWESCMTLNDHWGYCHTDDRFKSPRDVALNLAQVASGAGNLLLNVGPRADGSIPQTSVDILRTVGQWVDRHREALTPVDPNPLSWYLFGPTTVRGRHLYLFIKNWYGTALTVGGLLNTVQNATLLSTQTSIEFDQQGPQVFLKGLPETSPDPVLSVIRLDLDGPPRHDLSDVIANADEHPHLPA